MKYVTNVLIVVLLFSVLSCKKNSTGSDTDYIDVDLIWLGETSTWELTNINSDFTYRNAYAYHRGDEPNYGPSSFHNNSVEYLEEHYYKCKWIHYYKDESYIEFEKVGQDRIESVNVSGFLIDYK